MQIITSVSNPWMKRIKLLSRKKYRQEYGEFVLEGLRICEEAIKRKPDLIKAVFISSSKVERYEELLSERTIQGKAFEVSEGLLTGVLKTENSQEIAIIIEKPAWKEKSSEYKKIVVVDGVQDPGNLGTIARTALAAGMDAMYCLPGTVDYYNDKTVRATMGAILELPVFEIIDFENWKKNFINRGFTFLLADIQAKKNIFDFSFPAKSAVILGNEGSGCIHEWNESEKIAIPLQGGVESLNVAVAAGIIFYEIWRSGV